MPSSLESRTCDWRWKPPSNARERRLRSIPFIDEVHRFNSAQQDALPRVENGTVTLIGATTENPYFEVNKALKTVPATFRGGRSASAVATGPEDDERGYGQRPVVVRGRGRDTPWMWPMAMPAACSMPWSWRWRA